MKHFVYSVLVFVGLLIFSGCGGGGGGSSAGFTGVTQTSNSTYDSNANPIESVVNGKTIKYAYTYNTDNKIESKFYDYNNDRKIDQVDRYTYDTSGNLIMVNTYYDSKTTKVDSVKSYLYNNKNQIILERVDENGDGIIDVTITYKYTKNTLTSKEYDYDNDGVIDEVKTMKEEE